MESCLIFLILSSLITLNAGTMIKCGICKCDDDTLICRHSIPTTTVDVPHPNRIKKIDGRGVNFCTNFNLLKLNFPELKSVDLRGGKCSCFIPFDLASLGGEFTILTYCYETTTDILVKLTQKTRKLPRMSIVTTEPSIPQPNTTNFTKTESDINQIHLNISPGFIAVIILAIVFGCSTFIAVLCCCRSDNPQRTTYGMYSCEVFSYVF